MNTNNGSLVRDLNAHRTLSAQRAKTRSADVATNIEMELAAIVDHVVDDDVDAYLTERLIDEATSISDSPNADYDGDTMDAFSAAQQDAIDALIATVDAPPAVDGLVMALAWEILDITTEEEFLTIFRKIYAQVDATQSAAVETRLSWSHC